MLNKLKCRLRGHRFLCSQVITLDPESGADIDHTHECRRCGHIRTFPTEPLPDEMAAMLQRLVGPQNMNVSVDSDPPTYLH